MHNGGRWLKTPILDTLAGLGETAQIIFHNAFWPAVGL